MWPNEVWSAEFVFDRTADGRVLQCLVLDRALGKVSGPQRRKDEIEEPTIRWQS